MSCLQIYYDFGGPDNQIRIELTLCEKNICIAGVVPFSKLIRQHLISHYPYYSSKESIPGHCLRLAVSLTPLTLLMNSKKSLIKKNNLHTDYLSNYSIMHRRYFNRDSHSFSWTQSGLSYSLLLGKAGLARTAQTYI